MSELEGSLLDDRPREQAPMWAGDEVGFCRGAQASNECVLLGGFRERAFEVLAQAVLPQRVHDRLG